MIVILQGRLRSTRLPAKGFLPFFGQTVWERMCDIGRAIRGASEVVFATGDLPENHLARPLVEAKGVRFFAGSEDHVLERFCKVVESAPDDYVVRLTCDNYLIQPDVVEGLASAVMERDAAYGFVAPLSHFAGEVVSTRALLGLWRSGAYSPESREHVTWEIRRDPGLARVELPAGYLGLDHASSPTLDSVDDFVTMRSLEQRHPLLAEARCLPVLQRLFPYLR